MRFFDEIKKFFAMLFKIFSIGRKTSRTSKEKTEEDVEEDIIKNTEAEEIEGKKEETDIETIVGELIRIRKIVSEKEENLEIRTGPKTAIPVIDALNVLIHHVEKLINTEESVVQEEMDLKPIENYWMVVRQGLINAELHKDVEIVTALFKKLNIELEEEKKLHYSKIRLVQKQWELIQEETQGTDAKKGAVQKGKVPLTEPDEAEKRRKLQLLKDKGFFDESRKKVKV